MRVPMPSVTAACRHHWDIPSSDKVRTRGLVGQCRHCKAVREFPREAPLRRSPQGFIGTIQYSKHHRADQ